MFLLFIVVLWVDEFWRLGVVVVDGGGHVVDKFLDFSRCFRKSDEGGVENDEGCNTILLLKR